MNKYDDVLETTDFIAVAPAKNRLVIQKESTIKPEEDVLDLGGVKEPERAETNSLVDTLAKPENDVLDLTGFTPPVSAPIPPEQLEIDKVQAENSENDGVVEAVFQSHVVGPFLQDFTRTTQQMGAPISATSALYNKYQANRMADKVKEASEPKDAAEFERRRQLYQQSFEVASGINKELTSMGQTGILKPLSNPTVADWVAGQIGSGLSSALQSYVGARTVGSVPTLFLLGTGAGSNAALDAAEKTGSLKEAARAGFVAGAFEILTEYIPVKMMEKGLEGKPLRRFLTLGGIDALGEGITTLGQDLDRVRYDEEFRNEVLEKPSILLTDIIGSMIGSFVGSGTVGLLDKAEEKAVKSQEQRKQDQIKTDFHLVAPGESFNVDTRTREREVKFNPNPTLQADSPGILMTGNKLPEPVEANSTRNITQKPMYQLKSGVKPTSDHLKFLLQNNFNQAEDQATVCSIIAQELERGLGLQPGELVSKGGLSIGTVQEREPGYKYDFVDKDNGKGTTLTKNEDGTWQVRMFNLSAPETATLEQTIEEESVPTIAANLRGAGMKPDTFLYSVGENGVQELLNNKNPKVVEEAKAMLVNLVNAKKLWEKHITKDAKEYPTTPELKLKASQIKELTDGWYRDVDGKWKLETLKDNINLNPKIASDILSVKEGEQFTYKMSQFAGLETIDVLYPDIKDMEVVIVNDPNDDSTAYYNSAENKIYLNRGQFKNYDRLRDSLRHELQHVIQYKEDFGIGSNPMVIISTHKDEYKKAQEKYKAKRVRKSEESLNEYENIISVMAAYHVYETHLGEMEARQATHIGRETSWSESSIPTEREAAKLGIKAEDSTVFTSAQEKNHFVNLSKEDSSNRKVVQEVLNSQKIASVTMLHTGERLVQMFKGGNFAALMHEYGHVVLTLLNEQQLDEVASWAATPTFSKAAVLEVLRGKKNGDIFGEMGNKIYKHTHEMFAKTFEEYLRQGKSPNKNLRKVFAYCKELLTNIYLGLRKVPGSNLTPEIRSVFDELFMRPEEKFGGQIKVPAQNVVSGQQVTAIPETTYEVLNINGKASILIPDSTGKEIVLNVENLILGKKITKEQAELLGEDASWESPYKREYDLNDLELKGFRRDQIVSREQLSKMKDEKLNLIAYRMGFRNATKLYSRENIIDLVYGRMVAEATANDVNAAMEQLEEASGYDLGGETFTYVRTDSGGKTIKETRFSPPDTDEAFIPWLLNSWSKWLIDVVRDTKGLSGVPSKLHHQKGMSAIAASHDISGEQAAAVIKIQKLTRFGTKSPGLEELLALKETKYGRISQLVAQIDRRYSAFKESISPEAKKIVDAVQELLDLQGKIASRENMSIKKTDINGKEVWLPFHPGGNVFPRSYTEDFWRILTHTSPAGRNALTKAIAEVNPGMPIAQIQKIVSDMSSSAMSNKKIYMEAERLIDVMPTHIKLKGGTIEILHSDPFTYAQALQRKFAMRVGFFRHYAVQAPPVKNTAGALTSSQNKYVEEKILDRYVQDFEKDTGEGFKLKRLFNALNGVPVTEKYQIDPNSRFYLAYIMFSNYLMVRKSLWLTKSMWANLVEPEIKGPATFGVSRHVRSSWDFAKVITPHAIAKLANKVTFQQFDLLRDWEQHDVWSVMKQNMLRAGTTNEHMVNFAIKPGEEVRSATKIFSSVISKITATTGAIGYGEYRTAWTAHLMAEDLKAGKGTRWDVARLRILNFTEDQIRALIFGKEANGQLTPQSLYNEIPVRSVTRQMGTNTMPAERSLFHNWRHAGDVVIFDKFGATTFQYMAQVLRSLHQQRNGTPRSKYTSYRALLDNVLVILGGYIPGKNFSKPLVVTTITGVAAGFAMQGIRQLVAYGPKSFAYLDWDGDDDEEGTNYFKLIFDAYVNAQMSGPLASMYSDISRGDSDVKRFLGKSILPISTLNEIIDYSAGLGVYKDLEGPDKFKRWMKTNVPVSGALATWAMILGYGNKDAELEFAQSQFYKFLKKGAPDNTEWKSAINAAYNSMIAMEKAYAEGGEQKGFDLNSKEFITVRRNLERALGIKYKGKVNETPEEARERIASAFLGKRLFPKLSEEQKIEFVTTMNRKVVQKILDHDKALEYVADRIKYGE